MNNRYYNKLLKIHDLKDIKNPCPACKMVKIDWLYNVDGIPFMEVNNEKKRTILQACKSCGNIYVTRKQVLRRIE